MGGVIGLPMLQDAWVLFAAGLVAECILCLSFPLWLLFSGAVFVFPGLQYSCILSQWSDPNWPW